MAIPLAIGSVGDLAQSLTADDVGEAVERAETIGQQVLGKESTPEREPVEQSIGEFRQDFRDLLNDLDVRVLVVFIDDLDRCLPANIIDTLEAIRLFLAVPKTAFVIGADERIVRHAISTRYPEMAGQALSIGRDYLEDRSRSLCALRR